MKEVMFTYAGTVANYLAFYHGKHSLAAVVPCTYCDGKGYTPQANGEDDFDNVMCEACQGSGKILTSKI